MTFGYEFRIAKHLLTNTQYASFLNTVDPAGSNSLLSIPNMTNLVISNVSYPAYSGGIDRNLAAAAGSRYSVRDVIYLTDVGGYTAATRPNINNASQILPVYRGGSWQFNDLASGAVIVRRVRFGALDRSCISLPASNTPRLPS